jgi:hypothetical protein
MAAQAGFAPAPFRLTGGRTTVIPLSRKVCLLEGRAPRVLLNRSGRIQRKQAHGVRPSNRRSVDEIGHRGRTCTCGHLVPGQACCCYTTRCCPGSLGKEAGGLVLCGDEAWQLPGPAAASEIGALDGTCTHTLPADNGLLFYSATRAGGKCW